MENKRRLPPFVYVPVAMAESGSDEIRVEYRLTNDGRKAMLVYSALDRLVDGMGPCQPWLVCAISDLERIKESDQFDVIYTDLEVPAEHQRTPGR